MSEIIGETRVRVRPDTSTFGAETRAGVSGALGALSGRSILAGAGAFIGITTAAQAFNEAADEIIFGAAKLRTELATFDVVADATDDQMRQVGEAAKQLGADVSLPGVSAGDAAVALTELAKAGVDVQDSIDGARGVLQLATAGNLDIAQAAAIAGSALNAFGLAGDEATHVADLLAGASIAAQGEVNDMALALQQSAAVANQVGLSIEDTVGAITTLAQAGLKGSDAGTSFRTTLLRLIPTTKEAAEFVDALGISVSDAEGNLLPLPTIFEQYRQALSRLTPELQQVALTQIFGTDAIRAAAIFSEAGAEGMRQMTNEANRLGAANELASARTEGLTGALAGLKSGLETLAVDVGEDLQSPLEGIVRDATDVVGGLQIVLDKLEEFKGGGDDAEEAGKGLSVLGVNVDSLTFGFERLGDAAQQSLFVGLRPFFELGRDAREAKEDVEAVNRALDRTEGNRVEIGRLQVDEAARDRDVKVIEEQMKRLGIGVGKKLNEGTVEGILSTEAAAVAAARDTLEKVRAEGERQVRDAIAAAQRNLTSLGNDLARQAAQVIDEGPVVAKIDELTQALAQRQAQATRRRLSDAVDDAMRELETAIAAAPIERRIRELRAEIEGGDAARDRRNLQETLTKAQQELETAQQTLGRAGPQTARGAEANRRFLEPFEQAVRDAREEIDRFDKQSRLDTLEGKLDKLKGTGETSLADLRQRVKDAQDALRDFDTTGLIDKLRTQVTEQKKVVSDGIANLISQFNQGLIDLDTFNRRLASLLGNAGADYRTAARRLGTAFREEYLATLRGIAKQAQEILAGGVRGGEGAAREAVSVTQARQDAALALAAQQKAVQDAQLEAQESANGKLDEIIRVLRNSRGPGEPAGSSSKKNSVSNSNVPLSQGPP